MSRRNQSNAKFHRPSFGGSAERKNFMRNGREDFIVCLRGVRRTTPQSDIIKFLSRCSIYPNGIHRSKSGLNRTLRIFVEMKSAKDLKNALLLDRKMLNRRIIKVDRATYNDIKNMNETTLSGSKKLEVIRHHTFWVVRLNNLSWGTTTNDILRFFRGVDVDERDIHLMRDDQNRVSGDCYVELRSVVEYEKALKCDGRLITTHGRIKPRSIRVHNIQMSEIKATRDLLKKFRRSSSSDSFSRSRLRDFSNSMDRSLSPLLDLSPLRDLSPLSNLSYQNSPARSHNRRSQSYDRLDWNIRSRSASMWSQKMDGRDRRRSNNDNQWDNQYDSNSFNRDNPNNDFDIPDVSKIEWTSGPSSWNPPPEQYIDPQAFNLQNNYTGNIGDFSATNFNAGGFEPTVPTEITGHINPGSFDIDGLSGITTDGGSVLKMFNKPHSEPSVPFVYRPVGSLKGFFDEIKVHVVHRDYPNRSLLDPEIDQLWVDILDEINSIRDGNFIPTFPRSRKYRDGLLIACRNLSTFNWLRKVIKVIKPNGAPLRIIKGKPVLKQVTFRAHIPYHISLSPDNILKALAAQNIDLRTFNWILVDQKVDSNGQTLVWVTNNPLAVNALEKRAFHVYLGLTKIKLHRIPTGNRSQRQL